MTRTTAYALNAQSLLSNLVLDATLESDVICDFNCHGQNVNIKYSHGCHEGGAGGCSGPPLESELSFICIGFSLINDVRARVWPPPGKGGPPLENFLVTPMISAMNICHRSRGGGSLINCTVAYMWPIKLSIGLDE